MVEKIIRNALDCTHYSPFEEVCKVNHGMWVQFQQEISLLVDNEIGVDYHRYRISKSTLINGMHELILEIGNLLHKDPDLDIEEAFNRLRADLLQETIGSNPTTYHLAFPLNLLRIGEPGDSFRIMDTAIKRISRQEWKTQYENPAREDDSFNRFLTRESPNTLTPDKFGNERFSFWLVEYSARDPSYAVYATQRIVRLLLSELNFIHHRNYRELPRPSGDRPGYLRWSPLREPFCLLVFAGDDYIRYQAVDFDYRRRSLRATEDIDDYIDHLKELPELDPLIDREKDGRGLDTKLVDGLMAYQDGITTSSPQNSFFSFWRGIETLCHVKPEQTNSLVYERAVSLLELESSGDYIPWYERDALEDLSDRRNEIAHTGPHAPIENSHRTITKRILDKLLQFHFDHYEEFDEDDMRMFLKRNSHSIESNRQKYAANKRENQLLRYMMTRMAISESDQTHIR